MMDNEERDKLLKEMSRDITALKDAMAGDAFEHPPRLGLLQIADKMRHALWGSEKDTRDAILPRLKVLEDRDARFKWTIFGISLGAGGGGAWAWEIVRKIFSH